jgi:hypothetical protein
MLMTGTIETTIKYDHLFHLRRFLEQIELEEYYTLIVEKLKVRDKEKKRTKREKERRLKSISRSSSLHFFCRKN